MHWRCDTFCQRQWFEHIGYYLFWKPCMPSSFPFVFLFPSILGITWLQVLVCWCPWKLQATKLIHHFLQWTKRSSLCQERRQLQHISWHQFISLISFSYMIYLFQQYSRLLLRPWLKQNQIFNMNSRSFPTPQLTHGPPIFFIKNNIVFVLFLNFLVLIDQSSCKST